MPAKLQRVTPCFWFDDHAEEAVNFYVSVFPNSTINKEAAQVAGGRKGRY